MLKIALIFILSLCCSIVPLAAQDAPPDTGWPVEERCVGDPVSPPPGWTWDGTIFFKNEEGIRAFNAKFETPYFIIFADEFIHGAGVSPDGKWIAVPGGYTTEANSFSQHYIVQEIMLYSTDGNREIKRIPWGAIFEYVGRVEEVEPIRWIDNSHFIYGSGRGLISSPDLMKVNPFTGQTEIAAVSPNFTYSQLSPDLSRVIHHQYVGANQGWGVYDSVSGEEKRYFSDLSQERSFIWLNDSSAFVGAVSDEVTDYSQPPIFQLTLFDRDGNLIDTIANDVSLLAASPNSQYISFFSQERFYIADLTEKSVIDLCLPAKYASAVWSPDNRYIVVQFETEGDSSAGIRGIIDLQTLEFYTLYHQIGEPIAWGAAD